MAWGWGESEGAYREVYNDDVPQHHEGKFSHEFAAGAASFAAVKAWEDHQRKEGKPVSHAFAKEAIAGLIGAEVDKLAETKGLDWLDKEKTKSHARKNAEQMYDDHYVERHGPNGYDPHRYGRSERFDNY